MKAYFIFAIALTVAYIIYYAVMIARDLYGKNEEKIKSGEEEFDVSDFDEEESVSVVENDKGAVNSGLLFSVILSSSKGCLFSEC